MTEWVTGRPRHAASGGTSSSSPTSRYLDEVVFRAIGDDSVRLTGLQTGELDWIQRVPAQRVEELEGSSELAVVAGQVRTCPDMIMLNCSKPPFNDPRVRQAVAWLVDREEIVNLVWFGTAVAATEAVVRRRAPGTRVRTRTRAGRIPDKAKALLKRGRDRRPAGSPSPASRRSRRRFARARCCRSQLAKGGIEMQIQNFEPAQWFEQLATKKYDLTSTYWSATFDPAHLYFPIGYAKSPWNFPVNKSAKIDDGAREVRVRDRPEAVRKAAYPDVVRTVAEEAPILFLTNEIQQYWTKPKLHGARRRCPRSRSVRRTCGASPDRDGSRWRVPMLFGMSVLVFLIIRLVPGDPVLAVLGPERDARAGGRGCGRTSGSNDPLYVQYLNWLADVLRGDFGIDYREQRADRPPADRSAAGHDRARRARACCSRSWSAIPLGVLGAVRRGRAADKATQGVSLVGISVPDFWLGIMLILVFSLGLGVLPSSGFVPFAEDPVENLRHMLLPAIALAAGLAAVLIRITRAAMLDVLAPGPHPVHAREGRRESAVVIFKHALRNAAIPIVTVIGLQAGYLLGGAIVIEQVFALPGVGRLVLDSVLQRNYPVVQASVLVVGLHVRAHEPRRGPPLHRAEPEAADGGPVDGDRCRAADADRRRFRAGSAAT